MIPEAHSKNIEEFINTLPDPAGARAFLRRLEALGSVVAGHIRKPLLLSRLLTLASFSPFLGESLLRHPEHIAWLEVETERGFDRVKSTEQLSDELARFVALAMDVDDAARLARFKRRELLRVYLRDCLGIATLSEVTEELSNLADVILGYALARALQQMTNFHGSPQTRDQRDRLQGADFAIVALGKLGCRELNYASDVDLLFLYSGNGETAGDGRTRDSIISNKEFFIGVAERTTQIVGRSTEEGAVYRIDLRLRPYGRDGDLVWEIERAASYYRERAHNWERQALIRARLAAGSDAVVTGFLEMVRDAIFSQDALPDTLDRVRLAKEEIERKEARRMRGFNVKLGAGGIREIEFIAQALQLKHGGREPWVRSAQTLIVLARLAEKRYLTEPERARLSAAYSFLRTVEHRLQMEHGAQTHTLPSAHPKLEMLARRCGFVAVDDPATRFMRELENHTSAVRGVYNRVFAENAEDRAAVDLNGDAGADPCVRPILSEASDDETERLMNQATLRINRVIGPVAVDELQSSSGGVHHVLAEAMSRVINPVRSLKNLTAWADSFSTCNYDGMESAEWAKLIARLSLVLSSQYLAHLLIARPMLATALLQDEPALEPEDFLRTLSEAVEKESDAASKADAVRRAWCRSMIEIGYRDLSVVSSPSSVAEAAENSTEQTKDQGRRTNEELRKINLAQTALAEAALRIAIEIALESIGLRGMRPDQLPFAILGLGRLGHAGMDYGSDLDLLVVFDDDQPWPPPGVTALKTGAISAGSNTPQEFYARLTSRLVRVLSTITREGLLYRIDLRLRPEGKSGPVALGLGSLLSYLQNRASAWEHSAYLKAREVAGDLDFGARARKAICDACFDAASRNPSLREELAEIRERLVREKARSARPNIKWGRGGMTDVYFVTRYLQLRDRIYVPPREGTTAVIAHLGQCGSLDRDGARVLLEGYSFLRRLDHWIRLLQDRPSPALPAASTALRDIARALGLASGEEVEGAFLRHASSIREVYDGVFV